jgi:hypothetical protein
MKRLRKATRGRSRHVERATWAAEDLAIAARDSSEVFVGLVRQAVKFGLRKIASIPADVAFSVTNIPQVLTRLEARHDAARTRPADLSAIEKAAVAQLEQSGVFVTDVESLGFSPESVSAFMASGERLAAALAARGEAAGSVRPAVTTSEPADLLQYPEIYRWGLNPIILGIVEAYLRAPVAYDGPLVFHAPADGRETGSRRWHVDREDRRVIKVGLYLHDVSDSGGPFQLINHDLRGPGDAFRYRVFDTRHLEQVLGRDVISRKTITCPGKRGTLFFAETGRFYHRGKPATDHERSTIFFSYFARSPRHPFYCARSGLTRSSINGLIEGLSLKQQSTALWRDGLPLVARLIPPSLT